MFLLFSNVSRVHDLGPVTISRSCAPHPPTCAVEDAEADATCFQCSHCAFRRWTWLLRRFIKCCEEMTSSKSCSSPANPNPAIHVPINVINTAFSRLRSSILRKDCVYFNFHTRKKRALLATKYPASEPTFQIADCFVCVDSFLLRYVRRGTVRRHPSICEHHGVGVLTRRVLILQMLSPPAAITLSDNPPVHLTFGLQIAPNTTGPNGRNLKCFLLFAVASQKIASQASLSCSVLSR